MKARKFYIIAGESSGDLYGADLVKALQKRGALQFSGFGGEKMAEAGVHISRHIEDLAMTGYTEVLLKAATVYQNFAIAKKDILQGQPDALILIDYPGFNLRMAKWAKEKGFQVYYYIAPQTWAWKEKRNDQLRDYVDKLFVIFPFERDFFTKWGIATEYVGHPLIDVIKREKQHSGPSRVQKDDHLRPIIAVFPGSRKNEVKKMSKVLLEVMAAMPDCHFKIAAMPSIPADFYREYVSATNAELVFGDPITLMQEADLGLIKSGTSTLQATLLKLPQIVFYKVNAISAFIMRKLAKIDYAALPNLILDKLLVPELLQEDFRTEAVIMELQNLLEVTNQNKQLAGYDKIIQLLGKNQETAELVAQSIMNDFQDH